MATPDLQFRIAAVEDAPQLQAMIQAAFRSEDSRQDWTADMELSSRFHISVQEVVDKINYPDSVFILATDASGLVACYEVRKRSADLARFAQFAVDQRHQRRGLGRKLLAHAEDYCQKTWGVKKIDLNALNTRQELISWYERCGYKKTGVSEPFSYDRYSELPLPEGMCFIMLEKDLS